MITESVDPTTTTTTTTTTTERRRDLITLPSSVSKISSATILWQLKNSGDPSSPLTEVIIQNNDTDALLPLNETTFVQSNDVNTNAASFLTCVVPETDIDDTIEYASPIGYVLTENPIGFQIVNVSDGTPLTFYDIHETNMDTTIDAYTYVPYANVFFFLISSIAKTNNNDGSLPTGTGIGRIAAYDASTGSGLWSFTNDPSLLTSSSDDVSESARESPILNWRWDPNVVTPILSTNHSCIFINFVTGASIAAFNVSNGAILWNTTLEDIQNQFLSSEDSNGDTINLSPNATLGGMRLHGSHTIYAGLYDGMGNDRNFNSGFLAINADDGLLRMNSDSLGTSIWYKSESSCSADYQGGIIGIPRPGKQIRIYVTDQFWGLMGFIQLNVSSISYKTQIPNDYSPVSLAISDDFSTLFGFRDQKYPTAFKARSGYVEWSQVPGTGHPADSAECDTTSIPRNPPPVVDRHTVYYACGRVWYGFNITNGDVVTYGTVVDPTSSNGEVSVPYFISMELVNGVLYTTETDGIGSSYVTAWGTNHDPEYAYDYEDDDAVSSAGLARHTAAIGGMLAVLFFDNII